MPSRPGTMPYFPICSIKSSASAYFICHLSSLPLTQRRIQLSSPDSGFCPSGTKPNRPRLLFLTRQKFLISENRLSANKDRARRCPNPTIPRAGTDRKALPSRRYFYNGTKYMNCCRHNHTGAPSPRPKADNPDSSPPYRQTARQKACRLHSGEPTHHQSLPASISLP